MTTPDPAQYIDLTRYPIDRPCSAESAALLARVQADLQADGCAVLKGFVNTGLRADCLLD